VLGAVLPLVLTLTGVAVPAASAAVTVSRAEVNGTELRLEGRALANRAITVDGVQMGTSDGSGTFRIERSNFTRPADCTVDVNDGSTTPANARLSGCTVTSLPAAPTLSSLGLSPTSVTGGSPSTGTVTLSAAAPSGGQVVSLASNTPSAASVPSTVTVPAGTTSRTFTVTTTAVTASTPVTITATGGGVARSAVLTVTGSTAAAPTLSRLSLNPTTVVEGSTSAGTVTLTGPAPAGGLIVSLSSGNATAASVPSSVTVPAGATSATFTVRSLSTASTSGAVITASAGGVSRTATLTVNDSTPTLNNLSIVPNSVTGGSSTTGTVTLTAPATAGGIVVSLSSDQPFAAVPASVTVAAGNETASFTITTAAVSASTSALIRATHGTATRAFTLAVTPAATGPALSAVTLSSTDVVGGTPVTGTVTLVSAAPQGGQPVVLTSDNTNAATVPPSVTVPAGATRATFPVETKPVASAASATIVGEAGGARRGATITVRSQFNANNGSLSLARGGNGEGRVVSTPAGIDCTLTRTGTTGRCGNAFFPVGTRIRLDARPLASSQFQGWDFEVSCRDAPNVTIAAGVAHICRPVFRLR
jgi:hypothetical protein